jgi:hypothetical protein
MHFPVGRTILAAFAAAGIWFWWSNRPIRHTPGILIADGPQQQLVASQLLTTVDGFDLTSVARYRLRGLVLGRKRYHGGIQSQLVPVDIAVGWGRMSDQSVLDQFDDLSMSNRFFFYQWENTPPIPPAEIMRSAANNHVIAADRKVASAIGGLRRGQIVEMEGWLVDVTGPDGFRWTTSRRRDDTGNGACEVFYVEKVHAWDEPPPKATAALSL